MAASICDREELGLDEIVQISNAKYDTSPYQAPQFTIGERGTDQGTTCSKQECTDKR
ncbi:hypothetical protein KDI_49170 [Dictyobacter arantiisoli]|uniref:Uncharacterized protein n=1 Tax=Dictyobacter arantiisoli TaxID=2014874 RepID=A0A5A5TK02_9CHLR|nr:hypothetical protein KDI_49170 [Dictyobacter arantiisoli]